MKITAAAVHHYRLPLRASWLTSAGDFSEREGWLLRLVSESGASGYGDCAPVPGSVERPAQAAQARAGSQLATLALRLIGMPASDALQRIGPYPGSQPAARLAVETALLDLVAQTGGVSLAAYLRGGQRPVDHDRHTPTAIAVNAALGSLDRVDKAIRSACDQGFQVLKIKVGMASVDSEIDQLRRIAGELAPGVRLRLDANCAWSASDAERFLRSCAKLPIEMLEEPLAQPTLQQLHSLQAGTAIALAIDESLSLVGLEQLMSTLAVRRLVIKPPRVGGLLPALELARRAASAGLECIVTSSLDSACGVRATAHLAAAIDNRLAHGLATSSWLAADTGPPPAIVDGQLILSPAPGLGFAPGEGIVFSTVAGRAVG